MKTKNLFLILTAAGSSTRMGTGTKKEYLTLRGGTVLSESALSFLKTADFSHLIITVPSNGEQDARKALFANTEITELLKNKTLLFVEGAETRQASIYNALLALNRLSDNSSSFNTAPVLIHDAARPFVSEAIIKDVIDFTFKYGAAVPAITPTDTQKELSEDGTIERHLIRKNLGAVQTPQGFIFEEILKCHQKASKLNKEFTDDTEIWDSFPEITGGKKVHVVKGDNKNIKITYPKDLQTLQPENKMIRIGLGTDLHKLTEGRKFFLGGIEIPAEKGELGHSDGDVLLHAISDALLGASGLGDIGSYFPPSDPQWKDADSIMLLKKIWSDVKAEGWSLNNLDCVVETEAPKILPWREKIIESIAQVLEVDSKLVFVKAKTNEKVDAVGNKEAVKAYCCCLLNK